MSFGRSSAMTMLAIIELGGLGEVRGASTQPPRVLLGPGEELRATQRFGGMGGPEWISQRLASDGNQVRRAVANHRIRTLGVGDEAHDLRHRTGRLPDASGDGHMIAWRARVRRGI